MQEKAIVESINNLIHALNSFKNNFIEGSKKIEAGPSVHATSTSNEIVNANSDEFEALVKALHSDKWPEAVNPNFICDINSEEDKLDRANGIVDLMIEEKLKDKKFLDLGCGEGQCAYVAADHEPVISVGYDIKQYEHWSRYNKPNLKLTTSFDEVVANGPYDIIVIFDVIDHITGELPIDLLKKAKQVLSNDGKIYMRVHPYTSKHATHLYHELNKAYAHLVFTPEEIKKIVPNTVFNEPNIKVTKPIATYQAFIEQADLKVVGRREITEAVEQFFKIPKIAERIMKHTDMKNFPEFQMTLQFIDYVLMK